MENEKIKVAFLFGAGVETGVANFNMDSGMAYLQESLFAGSHNFAYLDALTKKFGHKEYFNNTYTYSKNKVDICQILLKNFVIQKASHSEEFLINYQYEISVLLNDSEIHDIFLMEPKLNKYEKDLKAQKNFRKEKASEKEKALKKKQYLNSKFKDIMNGTIRKYSEIKEDFFQKLFTESSKGGIDYDLNIGVAGLLDSYFHTIINPNKYGAVKFTWIFNYYWACYFTILKKVLIYLKDESDFENLLIETPYKENPGKENGDKYTLDYLKVLNSIDDITKKLYSPELNLSLGTSYYHCIKEELNKYNDRINCCGVATTNYFRFCSTICDNTIYLNGQLKQFEYPEFLEVCDFSEELKIKEGLFFPFVFGQSLVKPIVNAAQTEEYSKFYKLLLDSDNEEIADVLVIMGYNINEDDNHINTFLHDFVRRGKRMIILTGKKDYDVKSKLKCDPKVVELCVVNYNDTPEKITRQVFEKILKR